MLKLLLMQFSSLPSYLAPIIPKYLPQYPVLEHPQPISKTISSLKFKLYVKHESEITYHVGEFVSQTCGPTEMFK